MLTREFIDNFGARATRQMDSIATEEATKHALVLPFLRELGYDVFDAEQVVPEFTADFGIRSGEKVDYAILIDGAPVMLIECKKVGDSLDIARASQLARYFNTKQARLGVLTDGIRYKFFSDLNADNTMDSEPFFEVDVREIDDLSLQSLNRFGKPVLNGEEVRFAAYDMNYIAAAKAFLSELLSQPDEEIVKLLGRRAFGETVRASRIDHYKDLTRTAVRSFVDGQVSELAPAAASTEPDLSGITFPEPRVWRSIADLGDVTGLPWPFPSEIRFPDGEKIELRNWRDIIRGVVHWLVDKGALTPSHCPIESPLPGWAGIHYVATAP